LRASRSGCRGLANLSIQVLNLVTTVWSRSGTLRVMAASELYSQVVAVPMHQRLADDLRRRISTGQLGVGATLPSEAQLCREFGVSRGPVRQALATLRAEGLIGGGRGKPPVVRAQPLTQPFETLLSFSRWARQIGREPGQRTLEIARRGAHREAADWLGPGDGGAGRANPRLRPVAGTPAPVA